MTLNEYFQEAAQTLKSLDIGKMDIMVERLVRLKRATRTPGRLFICGVGGSAANASHAVNDFRKICGIEAYTPTDNVAELTARTNDDGWETVFAEWLKVSRASSADVLLLLSVGGGRYNASRNLIRAVEVSKSRSMDVMAIVGPDGGYSEAHADLVLLVPVLEKALVTPLTESLQVVVLHAITSDERLKR